MPRIYKKKPILPLRKCKHKTLIQVENSQSMARCAKCKKVFGEDDEAELFNLIENDFYTEQLIYTRCSGITDEEIKESYQAMKQPV